MRKHLVLSAAVLGAGCRSFGIQKKELKKRLAMFGSMNPELNNLLLSSLLQMLPMNEIMNQSYDK